MGGVCGGGLWVGGGRRAKLRRCLPRGGWRGLGTGGGGGVGIGDWEWRAEARMPRGCRWRDPRLFVERDRSQRRAPWRMDSSWKSHDELYPGL